MDKGIIVSIQGYTQSTIEELANEAANGGAVAIRTDKPIRTKLPLIGLNKKKVKNKLIESYITDNVEAIKNVAKWAHYVAIDYRRCNPNLDEINDFCKENRIKVIADIQNMEDYQNIKEKNYKYEYITTALSVFPIRHKPDIELVKELLKDEKKIIAEGKYKSYFDVLEVLKAGCFAVCIGDAISNVYKLTRRYTTYDLNN